MTTTQLPLIQLVIPGATVTRNPGQGSVRAAEYRTRIERAVRTAIRRREITQGLLEVHIHVTRRPGRRGDVDNIAKPILDALREVLGEDAAGRADDHRVRRLLVWVDEHKDALERVEVAVYPHVAGRAA